MARTTRALEPHEFTLRSGGADGADLAFELGALTTTPEIWIPWNGFNGSKSLLLPTPEAFKMAATIHPVWHKLSDGAKRLHARNCHQVLGPNLMTPSSFVICWTDGGETIGGTATAIKLALNNNVPVLNLGKWNDPASMSEALHDFLIINGVSI